MRKDDHLKSCVGIVFFLFTAMLSFAAMADHHWSPYTMPESIPEGAKTHEIVKGDTLWDLAGHYLGNPFLWPQIWEVNRYITDPHWIYPGDVLVIPPVEPMEEEEVAEVSELTEEAAGETAEELAGKAAAEEVAETAELEEVAPMEKGWKASLTDTYCSPLIPDDPIPEEIVIIGNEENSATSCEGDIVYLSQGADQGISAGDRFFILENSSNSRNPVTGKRIGNVYLRTGELKVIAVQQNTATARITFSCQEIHVNNFCVQQEELSMAELDEFPTVDRYNYQPSEQTGQIIFGLDDAVSSAEGNFCNVSLGETDGLNVGDHLVVFRPDPLGKLPIRVMGIAVVLTLENHTAACAIVESFAEIHTGDSVGFP